MTNTPYGLVYKTTNLINGKIYIGQTVRIQKFLKNNYYGSGIFLKRAIQKVGISNFTTEIIKYTENQKELDELEVYYIKQYQSYNPYGYNIANGGFGAGKHSQDTKDKISKAHKGRKRANEIVDKIATANRGKKRTQEAKNKISKANYGKKRTQAVIDKIKIVSKTAMLGKSHSEDTKDKMSKKRMEHYNNYENRLKDSIKAITFYQNNQNVRLKISESLKGKCKSISTKSKISETLKNKPKVECPYCKKCGSVSNMKQWHFDKCKELKNQSREKISLETVLQNIISSSLVEADKLYLKV